MEYRDFCMLEPSDTKLDPVCPKNASNQLFKLDLGSLESTDHDLIYCANVRDAIGKL